MTFISLVSLQKRIRVKAMLYEETIALCNASFYTLDLDQIPYDIQVELNQNVRDLPASIAYKRKRWGMFDIIEVKTKIKREEFKKTSLIGGYTSQKKALYLKDMNKPLVVVGNTKIQGNVHLPKQGVRSGNISGHSYYGSALIYGLSLASSTKLPLWPSRSSMIDWVSGGFLNAEFEVVDLSKNQEILNSFNKSRKYIFERNPLRLDKVKLIGNILVQSASKITVSSDAQLEDVILIAPEIEIENNSTGNFQAFATKELTVGEQVQLSYPTVLALIENLPSDGEVSDQKTLEIHKMRIKAGAHIKGSLMYLTNSTTNRYKPQIIIEEGAFVTGEVYCEKNMELKGVVQGMVITVAFVAQQSGSVYVNHLYNARIISDVMPDAFCGIPLENTKFKMAKWLY